MSLPARYQELRNNAISARKVGRYREVALLEEQAYRLARQHDAPDRAFNAGMWAAVSWVLSGHPLRSLELLTELLADVPPEAAPYDVFMARQRAFEVCRCWMPSWETLQRRLEELDQMVAADSTLPPADIHQLRAKLLHVGGQWSAAVEQLEMAWSYKLVRGRGLLKFGIADDAVQTNLRLADRSAAGRWCDLLGETETHVPESRVAWYGAQTELALWDARADEAETHAAAMEDQAAGLQRPEWQQTAIAFRVRSLLLDTSHGDPAAARHPARHRLLGRVAGKPSVDMKHERLLLLADYRLACVRYAAGMPPVDDLWYQHPQTLPDQPPADPADFQQRVFHARRAYSRAMRYSQYLDECFQCDWRQKEIQDRQDRLEAIVTAVNAL